MPKFQKIFHKVVQEMDFSQYETNIDYNNATIKNGKLQGSNKRALPVIPQTTQESFELLPEQQDIFIRVFLSEHLMGETQNQLKKMRLSFGKNAIPKKVMYLPTDMLYLHNKKEKRNLINLNST